MSHTPGDWYVGTRSAFTQEIEILAGPLRAVGSAYTEDDARVMAAAPRLLKACQAFSRLYGRLWDLVEPDGAGMLTPESVVKYDQVHKQMSEAIKEATGGTV